MKRPRKKHKAKILNCMVNDTISDMLTRIRNAQLAKHSEVAVFNTNVNQQIVEILYKEGFIKTYAKPKLIKKKIKVKASVVEVKTTANTRPRQIKLSLKYLTHTKIPCISKLQRLSSPGLRRYVSYKKMPNFLNGMGLLILTTSKGIMTHKEAKRKKVGGELLCAIC